MSTGRFSRSIRGSAALAAAALALLFSGCPNDLQNGLLEQIRQQVSDAATGGDTVDPVIGAALAVGTVGPTTVQLSWGAASDNQTAPADLSYRVVRASTSGELSSVESALQQAEVMAWTAAAVSCTASGLAPYKEYWFAVLVRDAAGNTALYAPKSAHTLNASAPAPGSGPFFSSVGQTSLIVGWTAASDDVTQPASLQYKLVRADDASEIDTVEEADAVSGAGLLLDWTANALSKTVTGLGVYTLHYFVVLVRDGSGSTANKALYAPQSVRTLGTQYMVTFDAQGGTAPSPSSKTVNYGSPYGTLASTSRTGYTLAGWWTGAGGTGTEVTPGTTAWITADQTLYAKWTANTYTVTFDTQGGSAPNPASKTVAYGSPYGTLAAATRSGYALAGWWTGPAGTGTQVSSGTTVSITANQTLYARWSPVPWARTPATGPNPSRFESAAVDGSGNVYAAGTQRGTSPFTYGTGVGATGSYSGDNAVLVKYSLAGTALWARVLTASPSAFNAVAVDTSGNVYAAGYQHGVGVKTAVVVKYNPSGTVLWAQAASGGGGGYSEFLGLAVDGDGNVYAAGCQQDAGTYTYGTGVSVAGSYDYGTNAVVVKYDSSGTALWARSTTSAWNASEFRAAAVDAFGNLYAAGYQKKGGTFQYGGTASAAGGYASGENVVLVKYDSAGTAGWARSVGGAGIGASRFHAVTVRGGSVYVAGFQTSTPTYTYGTGVSASASASQLNSVLVKYDTSGTAGWVRTAGGSGSYNSEFRSLSSDAAGNVYAAGYQEYTAAYTYGTGVSSSGSSPVKNVALVKYDASGTAQWARALAGGTGSTEFAGCAVDADGSVLAAGYQSAVSCTYAAGVSAVGPYSGYTSSENAVVVKYAP